jgi:hypothetical protein
VEHDQLFAIRTAARNPDPPSMPDGLVPGAGAGMLASRRAGHYTQRQSIKSN